MRRFHALVNPVVLAALLVGVTGLGVPAGAAQKRKPNPPPSMKVSEEDPRLKSIRGDLEAIFRHWDADRDNKVTAAELARGFRGKDAVPYSPPSPGEGDDAAEAPKTGPRPREMKLPELARKYPDYNFLLHWDKDRDDAVSFSEFQAFVDETSGHYRALFEKMDEIERLNKMLTIKNINATRRAQISAQLKVLDTQLWAARAGFRHALSIDHMAKGAALRRGNWVWYQYFKRGVPAPAPKGPVPAPTKGRPRR